MLTTVTVLISVVVLLLLAVFMGWGLGWAEDFFRIQVDPKVEAALAALPGANCGGCGFVGCAEYAEAVGKGKAPIDLCAPGGTATARKLADAMGVAVDLSLPYRPVVHCTATFEQRLQRQPYHGEATCTSANLVAGLQGCTYGCLGLSDCVRACKYNAIHVVNGLATVDYTKCIGCKACAKACPRNIITMVPFKCERVFVIACSNKDMGKAVSDVCTVGCIGCKACAKANPELITIKDNLPVINYDKLDATTDVQPIRDKCRRGGLIFVGKPSAADQRAVRDEKVPPAVKADFKTTVDQSEWRG